jgi:hypothetical protein
MKFLIAAGLLALLAARTACGALLDFPTENRALLDGHPEEFYMYVNRDFEGVTTKPWEGGQYGYVRGPVRSGETINYITMHEGVDIRPMHRDAQGNPQDVVRAAAEGEVVYVNPAPGASNYGRYIVLRHRFDGCPYYTLYAHLASPSVTVGQAVRQGDPIGIMGFSGSGIDRERSHVHFEVCMLLSEQFDTWHAAFFKGDPNRHGLYNGINLAGINPAPILVESQKNPNLKISEYFAGGEPAYKIRVKNTPNFSLIRNYPWLVPPGENASPQSWEITLSKYGTPMKVEGSDVPTAEPVAVWVKDTTQPARTSTRGMVTSSNGNLRLTDSGMRFAKLLTWPD